MTNYDGEPNDNKLRRWTEW